MVDYVRGKKLEFKDKNDREVAGVHDEKVIEAFQKFDSDGSGNISKEELAEVLKALNPDDWDNASVDEVMAQADKNGDGELSIKEFLNWAFAESDIITSSKGNMTLRVEGCPREEFNGDYVQDGKFYNHRPTFYCRENDYCMFYLDDLKAWCIFWRVSPKYSSCRLKTSRGPHMASEGEAWHVWTKEKKAFVKSPAMVCRLLTAEELVALAPDTVIINFEQIGHCWFEAPGAVGSKRNTAAGHSECFKKTKEMKNDRPVYQAWNNLCNEFNARYLFYHGKKKYWMVGVGSTETDRKFLCTEPTDCYSPLVAPWLDSETFRYRPTVPHELDADGYPPAKGGRKTKFKKVQGLPEGWKDPDFPANKESLGPGLARQRAYWERLAAYTSTPVLFDDAEPGDVLQGMLGDCWLLSAIAAVAEFPNFFKDHLFVTQEIPEDGKYEIKLFDCKLQEWKVWAIDDYIPTKRWGEKIYTLCAAVADHKILVPLVEKAIAKMCGSYTKLEAGRATTAWAHLTGCCDIVKIWGSFTNPLEWVVASEEGLWVREENQRASKRIGKLEKGARFQEVERARSCIRFKKLEGSGPEEGFVWYYKGGKKTAERVTPMTITKFERKIVDNPRFADDDADTAIYETLDTKDIDGKEFWQLLLEYDQSNFLMCAAMNIICDERLSGIMPEHAYSVLQAKEVEGLRFVQLRNPWGHDEWGGPWSDRSDEWAANPTIQEGLKAHELTFDGKFWMEYEDFQYVFGNLDVTKKAMPTKRADFPAQPQDELAEDCDEKS
ncbi:unnamed protein product [Effrenium voratum]|nr:unnamed protein product [Effrenium voratum]